MRAATMGAKTCRARRQVRAASRTLFWQSTHSEYAPGSGERHALWPPPERIPRDSLVTIQSDDRSGRHGSGAGGGASRPRVHDPAADFIALRIGTRQMASDHLRYRTEDPADQPRQTGKKASRATAQDRQEAFIGKILQVHELRDCRQKDRTIVSVGRAAGAAAGAAADAAGRVRRRRVVLSH